MQLQMKAVEEACKELYIRALKVLPDDVKAGIERLNQGETDARAQVVLKTMITNISVAEREDNLLCQDTGLPIYKIKIGRNVQLDGMELKAAIRKGCERATTEYPLREKIITLLVVLICQQLALISVMMIKCLKLRWSPKEVVRRIIPF